MSDKAPDQPSAPEHLPVVASPVARSQSERSPVVASRGADVAERRPCGAATVLLNGHMPVHVVRELVGHEDLATTQKYAEVIDADKGAAVGVLGRANVAGRAQRDAKANPEQRGATARRAMRGTGRSALLRSRALERARGRGNALETEPIAAE